MAQRGSDALAICACPEHHRGPKGIHGDKSAWRNAMYSEMDALVKRDYLAVFDGGMMSDFECLPIGTAARLAELEQEVERLRELGVGYSQQTMDAVVREREELRAEIERLRAQQAEPAVLWYLSGDGYAPVTLEQSHPPEPLTLDEALAHGWRRFYSAPPAQQAEPVADAETYLRDRYGAARGHHAWRELTEAFNAGCASAQQAEPVAWRYRYSDSYWRFSNGSRVNGCEPGEAQPLYTHPPRREWQGLTDEEGHRIVNGCQTGTSREIFRAIEAALKEKNHG